MNTKDPLHFLKRPMIRSNEKALKEALRGLVGQVSAKNELGDLLEHQEEALVHLILVQKGPIHPYLGHEVSITRLPILYHFLPVLFSDVSMCFVNY